MSHAHEVCECGASLDIDVTYSTDLDDALTTWRRDHRHRELMDLSCVDELADRLTEALIAQLDRDLGAPMTAPEDPSPSNVCTHGTPYTEPCDKCDAHYARMRKGETE